eukprot:752788-Hanusia_phi.AAC.3
MNEADRLDSHLVPLEPQLQPQLIAQLRPLDPLRRFPLVRVYLAAPPRPVGQQTVRPPPHLPHLHVALGVAAHDPTPVLRHAEALERRLLPPACAAPRVHVPPQELLASPQEPPHPVPARHQRDALEPRGGQELDRVDLCVQNLLTLLQVRRRGGGGGVGSVAAGVLSGLGGVERGGAGARERIGCSGRAGDLLGPPNVSLDDLTGGVSCEMMTYDHEVPAEG